MAVIETEYQIGDEVEIVIGDENDLDSRYDGRQGEIVGIDSDDLSGLTGDSEDDFMYTIKLEDGEIPGIHFRSHDLAKTGDS